MTEEPQVSELTIDRTAGELRVAFDDGLEGTMGLAALRLACPCAGCRRARQFSRATWTPAEGHEFPSVRSAELVGAWGLAIVWDDGHSTGIYPFTSLAQWARSGRVVPVTDPRLGP